MGQAALLVRSSGNSTAQREHQRKGVRNAAPVASRGHIAGHQPTGRRREHRPEAPIASGRDVPGGRSRTSADDDGDHLLGAETDAAYQGPDRDRRDRDRLRAQQNAGMTGRGDDRLGWHRARATDRIRGNGVGGNRRAGVRLEPWQCEGLALGRRSLGLRRGEATWRGRRCDRRSVRPGGGTRTETGLGRRRTRGRQ